MSFGPKDDDIHSIIGGLGELGVIAPVKMGSIDGLIGFASPSNWRDVAEEYFRSIRGLVALLLTDESAASVELGKSVSRLWRDIDRATGNDVIVLAAVAPPKDWSLAELKLPRTVAPWALQAQLDFASHSRRDDFREVNAKVIAEMRAELGIACPALAFLDFAAAENGLSEITACAVQLPWPASDAQLVSVFALAAAAARVAATSGRGASSASEWFEKSVQMKVIRAVVAGRRAIEVFKSVKELL